METAKLQLKPKKAARNRRNGQQHARNCEMRLTIQTVSFLAIVHSAMKDDNPFDKKITAWEGRIPTDVHDAAVFVTDTLELSWAAAQSVFENKATPEIAFQIYERISDRSQQIKKMREREL